MLASLYLMLTLQGCGANKTEKNDVVDAQDPVKEEKGSRQDTEEGMASEQQGSAKVPLMLRESGQEEQYSTDAVLEAALSGHADVLQEVLATGFDANATDADLHTALMMAAYNGHTEIVEMLIAHGAEVNSRDAMNRTALMYASTGPFNEVVRVLLKAGADPNLVDSEEHFSALMFAAAEGQTAVVTTLLEHGADKTLTDVDGESAYDFASTNGHAELAKLLK